VEDAECIEEGQALLRRRSGTAFTLDSSKSCEMGTGASSSGTSVMSSRRLCEGKKEAEGSNIYERHFRQILDVRLLHHARAQSEPTAADQRLLGANA
jgi:hypothetical protein